MTNPIIRKGTDVKTLKQKYWRAAEAIVNLETQMRACAPHQQEYPDMLVFMEACQEHRNRLAILDGLKAAYWTIVENIEHQLKDRQDRVDNGMKHIQGTWFVDLARMHEPVIHRPCLQCGAPIGQECTSRHLTEIMELGYDPLKMATIPHRVRFDAE